MATIFQLCLHYFTVGNRRLSTPVPFILRDMIYYALMICSAIIILGSSKPIAHMRAALIKLRRLTSNPLNSAFNSFINCNACVFAAIGIRVSIFGINCSILVNIWSCVISMSATKLLLRIASSNLLWSILLMNMTLPVNSKWRGNSYRLNP